MSLESNGLTFRFSASFFQSLTPFFEPSQVLPKSFQASEFIDMRFFQVGALLG